MKTPTPQALKATPQLKKDGTAPPPKAKSGGIWGWLFLVFGLIGFAVLVYFFGIAPRQAVASDLDHEQKLNTTRTVLYATAHFAQPQIELPLPGTIESFQQTSVYARTSGYVKKWLVDIGQPVNAGDLLAELDTPEVDQQLNQARATLQQAQANVIIANKTAERYNALQGSNAVSQQEVDQNNATRAAQVAAAQAAEAEVKRLTDLQNFKFIRAPFSGTITFRGLDVGNLVNAGNGNNGQELYRIAQIDPLRIFVQVPEAYTPSITIGLPVKIVVAARPGQIFIGQVDRTSGTLDQNSRTLLTEIRVDNKEGKLLPGYYVQARLQLVSPQPSILVPANTLIVNANGTQVVLLKPNERNQDAVHFQPIVVGRDLGQQIEVISGVDEGDRLITNPAAELVEGDVVTAKAVDADKPKP